MSEVPTRLLRDALREQTAPPSACLDADALAAWSDGRLSGRERAAAESHAAGCARCQTLLAAMARTAPPAPARRWWRASRYGWLVPLAAAAAAVVLWVTVPRPPLARWGVPARATADAGKATPAAQTARADSPVTPRPTTTPAAAAGVAPQPPAKTDQRRATDATARSAAVPQSAANAVAATNPLRDAVSSTPAPSLPPPTSLRAEAFAPAAPPAPPGAAPVAPPAAAQPAPGPATAAGAIAETVTVAPNATESVAAPRDRAAARATPQAFAKVSAQPIEIVSPDPRVRWRLRTTGSVERSTDGGTTWRPQSTGVAAPLVAGAAPSQTVCWLVGPGGIVLRSIDGATWQRVAFPGAIDLRSILALDAANATVTAADGRTFTTVDGGKTWRLL